MIKVKDFTINDLKNFNLQLKQKKTLPHNWRLLLKEITNFSPAVSFFFEDNLLAVAGLLKDEHGFQAWALINDNAGNYLLPLLRGFKWFLEYFKKKLPEPITMFREKNWLQAARMANILGFKVLPSFTDSDYDLWFYKS